MTIYQKIAGIQKNLMQKELPKSGYNKFGNFNIMSWRIFYLQYVGNVMTKSYSLSFHLLMNWLS